MSTTFSQTKLDQPDTAPRGVFTAQPWASQGLCAQIDTDLFYPEKGGSTREAKSICARCFVQAECLDYALTNGERFGIWGGTSKRERRAMDPDRNVPCTMPTCADLFITAGDRDRHVQVTHLPPKKQVTCHCGETFAHTGLKTNHARAHHPDGERTAS